MSLKKWSYRSTIYACYLGNFTQAIVVNVTPILFILLMGRYGLRFEQMGRLVLVNFVVQVATDLIFSRLVERYSVRLFLVCAHVCATAGLLLFGFSPLLFPQNPYAGFLAATVIFSCGGGLLELLLSPIVERIPGEAQGKAAAMSLLHSFYSWGQVAVVVVTTGLIAVLDQSLWWSILLMWGAFPLVNAFVFSKAPLPSMAAQAHTTKLGALFGKRFFLVCLLAILSGGLAEQVIAQWSSTFLETALGLPKMLGDMAGVCLFAVMMGVGRLFFGKFGARMDALRVMQWCAVLTVGCYLVMVFSPFAPLSLAACALCGLGVSLMWPGSLSASAAKFPLAGASMFAILAAGGDMGASIGPWLVGLVADNVGPLQERLGFTAMSPEDFGLRSGLLIAAVFPVVLFFCIRYMRRHREPEQGGKLPPAGHVEVPAGE